MNHLTFCVIVRFICFALAIFLLLVALLAPNRFSNSIRLLEAILATALVAWLCYIPV